MVASGDAEARAVIVEDGEQGRLPLEGGIDGTNEPNEGGEGEDGAVEEVELVEDVAPLEGRAGLCGFEGVLDVVVGDVEVGGDDVVDVRRRLGRCGGRHGG